MCVFSASPETVRREPRELISVARAVRDPDLFPSARFLGRSMNSAQRRFPGEGNKNMFREHARQGKLKNFLRNKAKMCFSFNLSSDYKPSAGLRRTLCELGEVICTCFM